LTIILQLIGVAAVAALGYLIHGWLTVVILAVIGVGNGVYWNMAQRGGPDARSPLEVWGRK